MVSEIMECIPATVLNTKIGDLLDLRRGDLVLSDSLASKGQHPPPQQIQTPMRTQSLQEYSTQYVINLLFSQRRT